MRSIVCRRVCTRPASIITRGLASARFPLHGDALSSGRSVCLTLDVFVRRSTLRQSSRPLLRVRPQPHLHRARDTHYDLTDAISVAAALRLGIHGESLDACALPAQRSKGRAMCLALPTSSPACRRCVMMSREKAGSHLVATWLFLRSVCVSEADSSATHQHRQGLTHGIGDFRHRAHVGVCTCHATVPLIAARLVTPRTDIFENARILCVTCRIQKRFRQRLGRFAPADQRCAEPRARLRSQHQV